MSQKLLITSRSFGQINEEPMNLLKEAGYDVTFYRDQFNMETFASMIPEYDVLIIGGHKFPAELMEKCPHLKLICKHGAGLDNLDLAKAKELGITVTNAARTNANAVADLAFGMMLNCARKISMAERDVRAGNWHTLIGHDVYQKTLGLIGFGAIARNMARRAAGFSMKVLAYDPFIAEVPEEFRSYVTLCADRDEVLRNCDYLSLHLQLTEETRNNISKTEMDKMRRGAVIINTSRGGIVNEDDLYDALISGQLSAAAMDVSVTEPMPEGPQAAHLGASSGHTAHRHVLGRGNQCCQPDLRTECGSFCKGRAAGICGFADNAAKKETYFSIFAKNRCAATNCENVFDQTCRGEAL